MSLAPTVLVVSIVFVNFIGWVVPSCIYTDIVLYVILTLPSYTVSHSL